MFVVSRPNVYPLFASFPEDIRRHIWLMTLELEPRIVEVMLRLWDTNQRRIIHHLPQNLEGTGTIYEPASVEKAKGYVAPFPVAFAVCRESRSTVRHLYHTFDGHGFYTTKGTLINPRVDIVYCHAILYTRNLYSPRMHPSFYYPERDLLSRLALDDPSITTITTITKLAMPISAFRLKRTIPEWKLENVVQTLRRYASLRVLILTEDQYEEYPPFQERQFPFIREQQWEPRFEEPLKWQPSDSAESAVMTNGFLHANVIMGLLKRAEDMAEDGWKAPEVKYVTVQRQLSKKQALDLANKPLIAF